ncbi:hypothetical protein SRB5_15860 [Streptomyces sp. RB5]|uniref:Uncharacterized protein n=1 Tax=Streptomyces smaragdinus TaxID=2585196 RepID=A0A7K0CDC0_9ACTN|nr:hypothetical protein [Streptomyces smaragdinus]MQY11468.1 hypothetical protein [Streptomyces smaragdinus]
MSQPPSAEPTLWELHRTLQQLREDQGDGLRQLRDDLRNDIIVLADRLEEVVTKDVYQADQRLVNQRLKALEEEQRTRANNRKWLVSAFVAPLLLVIVQLWLASRV